MTFFKILFNTAAALAFATVSANIAIGLGVPGDSLWLIGAAIFGAGFAPTV